jgi:glycosyltransferase involved in cell wall biosynthesis
MIGQLEDFSFYILTRNTDYCSKKPYTSVEYNKWIKHSENTKVYYLSEEYLSGLHIENIILNIHPDVLYINGIYSKFFSVLPLKLANKHNIKHIVAARGMLSPHALAIKKLKKNIFLTLMNLKKQYQHTTFHATQDDEAQHIEKVIKHYNEIKIIPNMPRPLLNKPTEYIPKKQGEVKMVYLGRIAKEKGTIEALQALKKCSGYLIFDIYGTIYDQDYWEKCKEEINTFPDYINVTYRGNLNSEEVLTTLKKYHALLLFSSGENYGHAIVESFLARRPVVISQHTPWKNLQEKNMGYDISKKDLPLAIQSLVNLDQQDFDIRCDAIDRQLENILDIKANKQKYKSLFY